MHVFLYHTHNQSIEHFHYLPPPISHAPLQSIGFILVARNHRSAFCHYEFILPFWEFPINEIIQDWLFHSLSVTVASCTHTNTFLVVSSFVWLSSVPWYDHTRIYLSIHSLMEIGAVSDCWLLWIKLQEWRRTSLYVERCFLFSQVNT